MIQRSSITDDPWFRFQRALIAEDRDVFEGLTEKARKYEQAIIAGGFIDPFEGKLLSICLENEKELRRLRMR